MDTAELGPAIKPLVWRDHRPDSFPEPAWSAQTPFGFYNIEEVSASDSPAYVVRLHAHHFIADKDSLEEAKAAAQVDYERRIRSALQDSPCCKGLAPITECQCEQDRLAAPRVSELDLRVQIDDLTGLNQKLTTDLNALALDWQDRAEKLSLALAAEQAINKDLKAELDEARADIKASISDFKVAGEQLSEAQDALLELRAAFVQAWGFEPGPENALYRPTLDKVDAALGSVNADAPAPFSEASQNYAERDPSVMAD